MAAEMTSVLWQHMPSFEDRKVLLQLTDALACSKPVLLVLNILIS